MLPLLLQGDWRPPAVDSDIGLDRETLNVMTDPLGCLFCPLQAAAAEAGKGSKKRAASESKPADVSADAAASKRAKPGDWIGTGRIIYQAALLLCSSNGRGVLVTTAIHPFGQLRAMCMFCALQTCTGHNF